MIVRPAEPSDAAAVAEIYAYYVENTAASFEEAAPGPEVVRGRMDAVARVGLPFNLHAHRLTAPFTARKCAARLRLRRIFIYAKG